MTTVLVVDDNKMDQLLAGKLLKDRARVDVAFADDGRAAVDAVEREHPSLVVTDLQMPQMNGLELVEALRQRHEHVPVVLMTAEGSEATAVEALRRGAASYVPKKFLSRDLPAVVERVMSITAAWRDTQEALACQTDVRRRFVVDNDRALIQPVIRVLRRDTADMKLCSENVLMRVAVALDEAITNAIWHSNLEAGAELSSIDSEEFLAAIEQRRHTSPYCDRRVTVESHVNPEQATFVITDDGRGFNLALLPDPANPGNLSRTRGRGLTLIRNFMDEVRHNDAGNQITLIKHREQA